MKKNHTPFQIACVTSLEEVGKVFGSGGARGSVWYMSSESLLWHGDVDDRPDVTQLKFAHSNIVYAMMPPPRFRDLLRAHGYSVIEPKDQLEWAKGEPKKPSAAKIFKPL